MTKTQAKKEPRQDSHIRYYRPQSRLETTAFGAAAKLLTEVRRYRSHIATLFGGDFRSAYRGTVLGVLWNVILPLVPISVYILLVNLRVFPRYDGINPSVYIAFNVTLWMMFTGMITRPISVVKSQNQQTMKTAMPMSVAITSSFAQLAFDTLVRIGLVCLLVVAFQQWPIVHLPLFLFSIFAGLVFCLSIGLALAILNVIYPDIDRITNIILQYGLFLSGVIFPVSTLGPLSVLEHTNPFNVFIRSARDYLFFGAYPSVGVLLLWTGGAVFMILAALRFFYIMEHRIREVV